MLEYREPRSPATEKVTNPWAPLDFDDFVGFYERELERHGGEMLSKQQEAVLATQFNTPLKEVEWRLRIAYEHGMESLELRILRKHGVSNLGLD